MSYAEFLARKYRAAGQVGDEIEPSAIHPMLHPWQAEIVTWAVKVGRAALWTHTGTGKTVMQLEWARLSGETALVVAPLAVSQQTVREAAKLGITATYVRHQDQVTGPGIWVTNYEMADRFDPACLDAVVLDESSRLKDSTGKTRTLLIEHFKHVPRRLACTATPAPNDVEELTNQAEFLGVATRVDMLATYFVHDDQGWRLKGHARAAMYRWVSTWAMAVRSPSDLGYPDEDYQLPGLSETTHLLPVNVEAEGQLFATDLGGVGGRAKIRRDTLEARCERAAEIVEKEPDEPWLVWCGLNDEADTLARRLGGSVNVHGSMSPDDKTSALLDFTDGKTNRLISKASIAGHGMNWQHCARMIFVGMNDSWEQYFQAVRRCHRYGQKRVVEVHIVLSELESQIADNVTRKGREADILITGLVSEMQRARRDQK